MSDENVYAVSETTATVLGCTSLEKEGLLERSHLQEWALQHPAILGEDLMVVTTEFDRWQDFSGRQMADRLDVLALDGAGRPVVVELKRGAVPRFTELQAVQYAAMVSRFSVDELARAYVSFVTARGEAKDLEEARSTFEAHTGGQLSEQRMRSPRIVLLAEEFGRVVTASTVWLSEQGVDLSLRQLQLYRSAAGLVLTVSQTYPLRDVEEFTVRPRRREAEVVRDRPSYPVVEWGREDLAALLARLQGTAQQDTVEAMLDQAAFSADRSTTWGELVESTPRSRTEAGSDLAQLTKIVRREFERDNWPVSVSIANEDIWYLMDEDTATLWRDLRDQTPGESHQPVD